MQYFTVKEIAKLLSVNDETVRRWIREGKLIAEKGSGRQGSKIESEALKVFLESNRGLLTSAAAGTLGIASTVSGVGAALGASVGAIAGAFAVPVVGALLGMSWLTASKQSIKDKVAFKEELETKKLELESIIMTLNYEISARQNELELAERQLEKLNKMLEEQDL